VIRAHPLYGWALRPGATMHSRASDRGLDYHIRIDSLGRARCRTRPMAGTGVRRILFLGDSMVFGAGVEAPQRCTELLETALAPGVEVVNAGVSGWGTDQEYLYLTHEGFGLHPDIVVLGVCMLNDVLNVMLPHELFGTAPKPRFVLDSGRLQLQPAAVRAAAAPFTPRRGVPQAQPAGAFRRTPRSLAAGAPASGARASSVLARGHRIRFVALVGVPRAADTTLRGSVRRDRGAARCHA
jgi:hypothetical protein